MDINMLISIVTRHRLLHVILTQKVMFSNKWELVSYTQKYAISVSHETFITCISNIPFRVLQFPLLLVLLSRFSNESVIHGK
jgi:hypothetical protein